MVRCRQSKFGKLSSLSKTLQEDPSCQLLTVLRKYLHKVGTARVEHAVASETVPQLITLQKGVLALMRQWKNVLYMPNLAEINFKTKKTVRPYNVTFSLPESESMDALCLDDEEGTVDNFDIVDERMSLLQAEGGAFHKTPSNPSLASKGRQSLSTAGKGDNAGVDGLSIGSSVSFRNKKFVTLFSQLGNKGKPKGVYVCTLATYVSLYVTLFSHGNKDKPKGMYVCTLATLFADRDVWHRVWQQSTKVLLI